MKIALRLRMFVLGMVLVFLSFAASAGKIQTCSFHVVVGSFSESFVAWTVANTLDGYFESATVKYDEELALHYVTVFESSHYDEAKAFRHALEKDMGFDNAWIYAEFGSGDDMPGVDGDEEEPISMELYTGGTILLSSSENSHLAMTNGRMQKATQSGGSRLPLTFAARTAHGIAIPGKVMLVDNGGRVVHTVKTGEVVNFSGHFHDKRFTAIFHGRGYSPAARVVPLGKLGEVSDVKRDDEEAWEVGLTVEKLSTDILSMSYHDLFHDGTAILRPEKKAAIDVLIAFMKARRSRLTEIAAHCDGDERRSVLLPGGRDYFDVTAGTEKTLTGKQLTKARAETLVAYLVSLGVERRRVEALGWGGLDPIARGEGVDPAINERVEVRIFFNAGD